MAQKFTASIIAKIWKNKPMTIVALHIYQTKLNGNPTETNFYVNTWHFLAAGIFAPERGHSHSKSTKKARRLKTSNSLTPFS